MKKQIVKAMEPIKPSTGQELTHVMFDRGTYNQKVSVSCDEFTIAIDHDRQRITCVPKKTGVTFHVPMCRVLYYVEA